MSKELKPLVFSINDLAYVDEIMVKKNFDNPHDHAVYKATEVDKVLAQKDFEIDRLKEFNAFLKNRISNGDVVRSILLDDLEQKDKEIAKLKADYSAEVEELCIEKTNVDTLKQAWKRSQRALWLSRLRALRNFSILAYFHTIRAKGKKSNMDFGEMAYRIDLARVKCHAKAEEFK